MIIDLLPDNNNDKIVIRYDSNYEDLLSIEVKINKDWRSHVYNLEDVAEFIGGLATIQNKMLTNNGIIDKSMFPPDYSKEDYGFTGILNMCARNDK